MHIQNSYTSQFLSVKFNFICMLHSAHLTRILYSLKVKYFGNFFNKKSIVVNNDHQNSTFVPIIGFSTGKLLQQVSISFLWLTNFSKFLFCQAQSSARENM